MTLNSKIIYVDSREQPIDRLRVVSQLEQLGYRCIVSKQSFGDYRLLGNDYLVIDRKKTLNELATNVGKEHERLVNEIKLAESVGAKIIFLIEHGEGIRSLSDVKRWVNPYYKDERSMTGIKLFKILDTMQDEYNIEFVFCTKDETGKCIAELLSKGEKRTFLKHLKEEVDWMWEHGE